MFGGFDAGKKVKGRKRHILTDSNGLLLGVLVTSASVQDRDGACLLAERMKGRLPRLEMVRADSAYRGETVAKAFRDCFQARLEIVEKLQGQKSFVVIAGRWVVERTFAWIGRNRLLSREHEELPSTSEMAIQMTMCRLMMRRLART